MFKGLIGADMRADDIIVQRWNRRVLKGNESQQPGMVVGTEVNELCESCSSLSSMGVVLCRVIDKQLNLQCGVSSGN